MEIEYFCNPAEWKESFEKLRVSFKEWTLSLGLPESAIHEVEIGDGDRAHYSDRTIDFEFDFPIGQKELAGLAYRTNFDLKQHSEYSKVDLSYFDEALKERFIPHCIEPSVGVERTFLAVLSSAYDEEIVGEDDIRTVLRFKPLVAPYQIAVLPLSKKPGLSGKAEEVAKMLKKFARVTYDETQSIGKRYRRQDEIGTPYCVTVDFDTLTDNAVTIRDRDTMEQVRVPISELSSHLVTKLM
jgi:glycyl-tRNA synthetase